VELVGERHAHGPRWQRRIVEVRDIGQLLDLLQRTLSPLVLHGIVEKRCDRIVLIATILEDERRDAEEMRPRRLDAISVHDGEGSSRASSAGRCWVHHQKRAEIFRSMESTSGSADVRATRTRSAWPASRAATRTTSERSLRMSWQIVSSTRTRTSLCPRWK
jgi:hypothetical protein